LVVPASVLETGDHKTRQDTSVYGQVRVDNSLHQTW